VVEGTWDDSFEGWRFILAFHGKCLTCSCLPISEDRAVVAFQYTLDDWKGGILVHEILICIGLEYLIESECLGGLFLHLRVSHCDLPCPCIHLDSHLTAILDLLRRERPTPYNNLHTFTILHLLRGEGIFEKMN